jgi:hypothetical protein
MSKPSDEQRKMLSEFIGENWYDEPICFHCEKTEKEGFHTQYGNDYDSGKHDFEPVTSRTFTSWADIEPVKLAVESKGLWERCEWYMRNEYQNLYYTQKGQHYHEYISWLFGKDEHGYRFCELVAEFMEGEG